MTSTTASSSRPSRSSRSSRNPSTAASSTARRGRSRNQGHSTSNRSAASTAKRRRSSRPTVSFTEPTDLTGSHSAISASTAATDNEALNRQMKILKRHLRLRTFTETWGRTGETSDGETIHNKSSIWTDLHQLKETDPSLFTATAKSGTAVSTVISDARSMLSSWKPTETDYGQYAETFSTLRSVLEEDREKWQARKKSKRKGKKRSSASSARSGSRSEATAYGVPSGMSTGGAGSTAGRSRRITRATSVGA